MGKPIPALLGIWRLVLDHAEDRKRRIAAAREMAALDPHERARVLCDAGLSRSDFGHAVQTPLVSRDLLSQAMRAIHIDPKMLRSRHGAWCRDMERVCMGCKTRRRCRLDLARSYFARRYQHYCPNAVSLAVAAANSEYSAGPA